MPQVIYSPAANRDLERLYYFLAEKNERVARQAIEVIENSLRNLIEQPQIGRPIENMSEDFREWIIKYSNSGYSALYNFDGNTAIILAIRHQKEVGF